MAEDNTSSKWGGMIGRAIREILAIAFWVHALCIWNLIPTRFLSLPSISLTTFNVALIALITNYALFCNFGWLSVAIDIAYIYFLPFIYVWRFVKFLGTIAVRHGKKTVVINRPNLLIGSKTPAVVPEVPPVAPSPPAQNESTFNGKEDTSKVQTDSWYKRVLRIPLMFTALWSILVFTVELRPLLIFVTVILIIGAFRAFWSMRVLFSTRPNWFSKAEGFCEQLLKTHREVLLKWDGDSDAQQVQGQVNLLSFFEWVLSFIYDNREMFLKWAIAVSVALSVPFYIYISYLFGAAYFGIGKVVGLQFDFGSAFLDSLYMPFAWTDLPHNFFIRLIGGFQAIVVGAMGWTIFVRHLGQRFDELAAAAERLRRPLREESFKQKVVQLNLVLSSKDLKGKKVPDAKSGAMVRARKRNKTDSAKEP